MPAQKPKNTFHFVTSDDATYAPGRKKAEKSRARAHAARVTHQRRQAKRGQTVVKWIVEGPESRVPDPQLVDPTHPQVPQFEISPWSMLSQAKVDPFETNPHALVPKQLQFILDKAYECIHPKVLSSSSENKAAMIKISWRRIGQEWPLMFHLQLSAAANLFRADVNNEALPTDIENLRMIHHGRGMAMVRKELKKRKGPASDALIMAQIMVALLTDPDQTRHFDTFRESPLATAQNLHLYARLALVPSMIQALLALVSERGGIESMSEFGNAELLQFADLMISSRIGAPPSFPWLPTPVSILKGPRYQPDHYALRKSTIIGSGFKHLDSIDAGLANILRAAGEITVALDHYQECRPNAPRLADLVNAANETQHKLLGVAPRMLHGPTRVDILPHICCVGGLIYNDLVLFPLPPTTQVRPRLAKELRTAMETFDRFEADETTHEYLNNDFGDLNLMVMWALMMGALAALNTPDDYSFFIIKLQHYVRRAPHLSEWQAFSNVMETYLWWNYIFDENATRLWTEVVQAPELRRSSESGESLYVGSSPTTLPIHSANRGSATELGNYGLPTPGSSEQSPQAAPVVQWAPIWSLPKDAFLLSVVWT